MNRKHFVQLITATATGVIFVKETSLLGQSQPTTDSITTQVKPKPKRPDPLKPEIVKDFVGKGHSNLDGVKLLLAEQPSLLNATWDWGGGDFESAIGGAGHMGRADIAEYLISQGARMDIFVAAMLGKTDIVKALAAAFPAMLLSKGPHGISLMTHAIKGGEAAKEVVEFLKSKGIEK
ncbi:MAG: hypothetical protein JNL70_07445 [Saprospiraceae bacterium]|nr:hypothetical protein [Saprospiraceae bacterium]